MNRNRSISALLGAAALVLFLVVAPASALASFGFKPGTEGFDVSATKQNGEPNLRAGTHPYQVDIKVGLSEAGGFSDGDLRNLSLSLPSGLLINPSVVSECSAAAFHTPRISPFQTSLSGESCPSSSQVGVVAVHSSYAGGSTRYFGVFNLVPRYGAPAALGFAPFGIPVVLGAQIRSDAGITLALENLSQGIDIQSFDITLWGTPWEGGDPSQPLHPAGHNPERGNCLDEQTGASFGECLVFESTPAPTELIKSYLTMPTTPCGTPLSFEAKASSWQGQEASATVQSHDPENHPLSLEKCNEPLTIGQVQLRTERAAAATGLVFNLAVNDGGGIRNPGGTARPAIRKAIVSLPEGLTINPSLGSGLGTCTEADFAREAIDTPPGAGCPNASKIGDVAVEGMLALSETIQGSVYVATPYRNPYNSLVALYVVVSSPRRGIFLTSSAKLQPDPHSGRLVITFDDLPRLLYTNFTLTLREGQRAALVSPPSCGVYPSGLEMSSWAQPDVFSHESAAFAITRGPDGGACPSGALPPFAPGLEAGSINPAAGAYTPFFLHMTRTDGDQEITSYSAQLPPGLLGNLSGIPYCPDAAIEAAKSLSGTEELEHPSCPAASRIGHTVSGYGVGGVLAYAPGGLFLAGPYHGAPISTVAIDSALVGPFDLGTVIVRSAIRVDPTSTQVSVDSAGSDPIPHILGGIPLHLRDIRVYIDRPDFTVNPTSCEKEATVSTLTGAGADPFSSADDVPAQSSDRYQLANCSALAFKPKLKFRFTAGFKRRSFPALRTELSAEAGEAAPHFVSVTLPRTEFIAQEHLRNICSKAQFNAGACPPDSVYGSARAYTPLLDAPLEGPVYLRSASSGLPDMVFALKGPGGLEVDVVGKIDSVHEALRATFSGIPDAPLSKFVLSLNGGKQGLIQNEKNICSFPQFANARLIGHNNTGEAVRPHLETRCPKPSKRAKRHHGGT
jgi:hypothetical protein